MKKMVFDVSAEYGGALTILKSYYEKAFIDQDTSWIFVVSKPNLKETTNIKIVRYPWIKKSWFHRIFFELFLADRIVRRYNIDEIISLQNTIIRSNVYQIVYVHQSIPFSEIKVKLRDGIKLWVIQNFISRIIYWSIKKADKVIVQTNWIKEACLEKVDVSEDKIEVIKPKLNIDKKYFYKKNKGETIFFYPANEAIYKNHRIIIEAMKSLKNENYINYKVVFTLNGNENKNIYKLYKICKREKLNVEFVGRLNEEDMNSYYSKSIIIFPSYLESFGLPLLEAKEHRCLVLASDCKFSHEILDDYKDKMFFNPYNSNELRLKMKKVICSN